MYTYICENVDIKVDILKSVGASSNHSWIPSYVTILFFRFPSTSEKKNEENYLDLQIEFYYFKKEIRFLSYLCIYK